MELKILPDELRLAFFALPDRRRGQVTELRFRTGAPVKLVYPWGEELLCYGGRSFPVTGQLLREIMDRATGFSPYAFQKQEAGLFLPLEGGCRLGLCGEAVWKDGKLYGLRHISSLVLRLARERRGIAQGEARRLMEKGYPESVLILSPPGRGKTTFLRDLIRCVSMAGCRVGVADERWELAAAKDGVPQLDLGPCTDVLSGCPKEVGLPLLLRVMNPQVLAVDELAGEAELSLAREAASCGVALFATAHSASLEMLRRRPGYDRLLEGGVFSWVITIKDFKTVYMERLGYHAEDRGCVSGGGGLHDERMDGAAGAAAAASQAAAASLCSGADAGGNGAAYVLRGRAV